jgi:hypothetical protein
VLDDVLGGVRVPEGDGVDPFQVVIVLPGLARTTAWLPQRSLLLDEPFVKL